MKENPGIAGRSPGGYAVQTGKEPSLGAAAFYLERPAKRPPVNHSVGALGSSSQEPPPKAQVIWGTKRRVES